MPLLLSYLRKSIYEDDRTASPDRQRQAIARVTPPGWTNRWYQDLDYSGQTSDRPEWQRLLSDLQNLDGVAGVAAESLSRLYRNRSEFERLKRLIFETGKDLLIANMAGVDGRTASGRMLLNIQADVDQFWAEQTAEHMRETIQVIIHQKGRHWGRIPFGCARDPQTHHLIPAPTAYWLDPETGDAGPLPGPRPPTPGPRPLETRYFHDALRAVYDLFAPGHHSFAGVAALANAAGWRGWATGRKTPLPFNRDTIREILLHWQLYAGQIPPPRKGRHADRPILPGSHDPILAVELCERVGQVLRERHTVRGPGSNKKTRIYLLSGILFCGECGQKLGGQRMEHGKYFYYRHIYNKLSCSQRMARVEPLEAEVLAVVKEIASQAPIFEELAAELRRLARLAAADDRANPLARLEQKRAEHGRLVDAYVTGLIDKADFAQRDGPIRAEIERLEVEAADLVPLDFEPVIEEALGRLGQLEQAEPLLLREIVHDLFSRIELRGNRLDYTPHDWARPLFDLWRWGVEDYLAHNLQALFH